MKKFTSGKQLDSDTKDQLRRASLSIMLNIAEGTARRTNKDKAHFLVMARGSCFECVSAFDYLKLLDTISVEEFNRFYADLEEISKMLFSLINHYQK